MLSAAAASGPAWRAFVEGLWWQKPRPRSR
uniref:Uncharacterized protein n=1 Tax=Arundo donax TaxID=35708 RepID=A0A0A9G505_ARUDO